MTQFIKLSVNRKKGKKEDPNLMETTAVVVNRRQPATRKISQLGSWLNPYKYKKTNTILLYIFAILVSRVY